MTYTLPYYVVVTDINLCEELSDSDGEVPSFCNPREKYIHGMSKGKKHSRDNVHVQIRTDGERADYAAKNFMAGDLV